MRDTSGNEGILDDGVPGDPDYFRALGKFVEAFSIAETLLFIHFVLLAEIDPKVARAVFAGIRCEVMIANIRHIWTVRPPSIEVVKELDPVLKQLKKISNVRNSVVHHMVLSTDEGLFSSNYMRALTPEHIVAYRVSSELLGNMSKDLKKIGLHLSACTFAPSSAVGVRQMWQLVLERAWLYKAESGQKKKSRKPSEKKSRGSQ